MLTEAGYEIKQLMERVFQVRYKDLEEEKRICRRLLELAEREEHLYGIAFANIYMGDYYIGQNVSGECCRFLVQGMKISEENGYPDLQLRGMVLMALYSEMIGDDSGAMQYYMEGLKLAKLLGDNAAQCRIYNNICNAYKVFCNAAEAKKYGLIAFHIGDSMEEGSEEQNMMYLAVLNTLVDLCIVTGELEEARDYAAKSEAVLVGSRLKALYVWQNWCAYYAEAGDKILALFFADKLLSVQGLFLENRLLGFDLCYSLCESMIVLNLEEYAWKFFELMSFCSDKDGVGYVFRLLDVKMKITFKFSDQQVQDMVYEEYYHKKQVIGRVNNRTRAEAMKNKIHLHEIMKEQENMKRVNRNLELEAHIDELTCLYNRRYFNKLKSKYMSDPDVKLLGYIMADVDCFKEYNDLYGHPNGDRVLKAISGCMLKFRHSGLFVCRFGGDEFICLCVDVSDGQIEEFISKVREDLDHLNLVHGASSCSDKVTLSIGYANEPRDSGIQSHELMELADRALYRSKLKGRNSFTRQRMRQGERI